jgi:hypothetical protein
VVDHEEEEEAKEMVSLWKKQGKVGEGRGVTLTRHGIVSCLCPHPLLHWCHYGASGSISGAKLSKTTRHLSIMWEGERAGAMMSGPLISGSSQTAAPFQFPFIVLEGRVAFFLFANPVAFFFWEQPPSPSPSISTLIAFQFQPRHLHFQPSSPFNFNLVTFQFPNLVAFPFPLLLLDGCGVIDAATTR